MELPTYMGNGILAFVVKQGALLSSKVRRAICDEAKGTSGEYIASAVYHNYPDSKRWVDTISQIKNKITDEQYRDLNESLRLSHEDAIFLSVKPEAFIVTSLIFRTYKRVDPQRLDGQDYFHYLT